MGWKTINGRRYYCKSEHHGGRVTHARFFRVPAKPRFFWRTVVALSAATVFVCTLLFLGFNASQDARSRAGSARLPSEAADADLPSEATDEGFPSAREIAQDIGYQDIDKAYLLAFKSEIDERPLFIESAIIAVRLKLGDWRLAHVYRHPKDLNAGATCWHLSVVYDAPVNPEREFRHRPSKGEAEQFLRDAWWEFTASEHFHLLRARIFSDTWEKTLRDRPNHQFSGQSSASLSSRPPVAWIH